jgi:hypothetical protein
MSGLADMMKKGGNPLKGIIGGKSKKNYKNKSSKKGGKKSAKKGTMKRGGKRGTYDPRLH